jgi:ArsR family transcriptional regulator
LDQINGSAYLESGELLVAGWRTGSLLSQSPAAFLDGLEATFAQGVEAPDLASEPDEVVDLIRRRLEFLAVDSASRVAYVALIRKLFALMAEHWERTGKAAAERAAEGIRILASGGADLRTLLPGNGFVHKDEFKAQLAKALVGRHVVVVPLGLAGAGQFFWSFPDLVLVGAGTESAEKEARRRERAERVASRLKVLSDPTRVSILFELLRPTCLSATVTELASQFGLSQPTVSVHIKMLREAGLALPERDGNQVHYKSDNATVEAYLEETLAEITGISRS